MYLLCGLLANLLVTQISACGYSKCSTPKPGYLNVHVVPHTHNDVGWLKTVDQYFYGSRNDIQRAGVQYILDSVVDALAKDATRRFIYVESAFFWRWWNQQNKEKKDLVKMFVNTGRLEFIGGGWSMNDEAAAHYTGIIDNMGLGLQFLQKTFGECGRPRVAWQIDPFGHSREQANIFAGMGYDGLFFGRLDFADKSKRMSERKMEMIWETTGNEKDVNSNQLFTGALYHGYSPPPGFCFDSLCKDVIMDDPLLEDYNLDQKIAEFVNYTRLQASSYATNNIILTMGEDFNYQNANMWFKNLDKLISNINAKQEENKLNLFYSTPSCYLKSLHDSNVTWPTKSDDFFPYASGSHSYWTGYFTSRPALKGMIRSANSLLQACKQTHVKADQSNSEMSESVDLLKAAVAVNQHHDAVTGTAKQHVTDDYALRLHRGMMACRQVISETLQSDSGSSCSFSHFCPGLNVSECSFTENKDDFSVNVYNPIAKIVSPFIRIPVTSSGSYSVTTSSHLPVSSQLVPVPPEVQSIPGRSSAARFELVFQAENILGLASKSFRVRRSGNKDDASVGQTVPDGANSKLFVGNGRVSVEISGGGVARIKTADGDIKMSQEFAWYVGMTGGNDGEEDRASGAYIFRPNGTEAHPVGPPNSTVVYRGPLVDEVHQRYSPWLSQVLRVYRGQDHVEMEWLVGPVPHQDGRGREVVSRYKTDIQSGDQFWTDTNGRGLIARTRNHRPTWDLNLTEPVSSNYYPVTTRLELREPSRRVTILTDRSQGGASLLTGQAELMLHRRLLKDDAFGVGEALNETAFGVGLVVRGKHFILPRIDCGTEDACEVEARAEQEKIFLQPVVMFGDGCSDLRDGTDKVTLPPGVQLVTMERWEGWGVLVRLENVGLEASGRFPLAVLFPGRKVQKIVEMTLDGNMKLSDMRRLQWNGRKGGAAVSAIVEEKDFIVQIPPQEIVTVLVTLRQ